DLFAARCHEGHHARHLDLAVQPQVLDLHAALEAARAHAQERDAVAVRRVHVGLYLEDEAGYRLFGRRQGAHGGGARPRRLWRVEQRVEYLAYGEVVDGGTEEHRRARAGEEGIEVERMRGAMHQFHFHLQLLDLE